MAENNIYIRSLLHSIIDFRHKTIQLGTTAPRAPPAFKHNKGSAELLLT